MIKRNLSAAGLAMLVGGVIAAVSLLVGTLTTDPNSPVNTWSNIGSIAGATLILAGFPGFYRTIARVLLFCRREITQAQ